MCVGYFCYFLGRHLDFVDFSQAFLLHRSLISGNLIGVHAVHLFTKGQETSSPKCLDP